MQSRQGLGLRLLLRVLVVSSILRSLVVAAVLRGDRRVLGPSGEEEVREEEVKEEEVKEE